MGQPKQMQFISTLLPLLPFLAVVTSTRDYDRRAMKSLVAGQSLLERAIEIGGYCPLPPKASFSQCSLALERVVKQPTSCAMQYMSGAARSVYLPIYNWFTDGSVDAVAQQFSYDNGVGVEVYDAFGNQIAQIDAAGNILAPNPIPMLGLELARTWPLNYPTFARNEDTGLALLAQNVWSVRGELLTIVISKNINVLPIVC